MFGSIRRDRGAFNRRELLRAAAAGVVVLAAPSARARESKQAGKTPSPPRDKPTRFQIACMTLPYGPYPLARALKGIKEAGYEYVAWGHAHREGAGEPTPIVADDAPPQAAKDLGKRCRDLGLEPVMMFGPSPENVKAFKHCIRQAAAGSVAQILTMGSTRGNDRKLWVKNFKEIGPMARDHGILIVVKQHGGNTGTGVACAEITREVNDEGVKVSYDAGNVMDYHDLDPLPDLQACADQVRSFCIKDHRNFPNDEDCGPGLGEIDHYKLLHPVAFTGLAMPLCCENISAPLVPRPENPAEIDALARRAREFLELVVRGLQA